jgi:hypothetical protein
VIDVNAAALLAIPEELVELERLSDDGLRPDHPRILTKHALAALVFVCLHWKALLRNEPQALAQILSNIAGACAVSAELTGRLEKLN